MAYFRPTAIIVTGMSSREDGRHWGELAHERALAVFGSPLVSELLPEWYGRRTFMVCWHGAKEGSLPAVAAEQQQAALVAWLLRQVFEDGSSPLRWVMLSYADDDGRTMVLATSADEFNRRQASASSILLEIDEPLKSALEWADQDGCVITDAAGWREGVEELEPRPLADAIGRGEYERRLEVSSSVRLDGGGM